MKLFLFLALIFSASVFAAEGVTADGVVFYKKAGALTKQEAKLFVPAKGQGKVTLTVGADTIEAHAFTTKKAHERTVFNVVFLNPPQSPKDTAILFTGSYLRGSNVAVYYGDIYAKHGKPGEAFPEDLMFDGTEEGVHHLGGFGFKANVQE